MCMERTNNVIQYSATTLLGQQYVAFICDNCIPKVREHIESMTTASRISYLTSLGQRVMS